MNHAQEQSSHTSAGHSSCGTRGAPKARRPGGPRPAGGRGPRRGPQPVRPSGTKGSPVALLFLLLHIPKPRKCPFLAAGVLAVRRNHTGKSGKTVAYPRAALELWRRGARCCRQMGAVEDSMKDWPPWGDPRQMRPGVPPGNAPPAQRERDKPGGGEPQGPQGRRGGCAAAPPGGISSVALDVADRHSLPPSTLPSLPGRPGAHHPLPALLFVKGPLDTDKMLEGKGILPVVTPAPLVHVRGGVHALAPRLHPGEGL